MRHWKVITLYRRDWSTEYCCQVLAGLWVGLLGLLCLSFSPVKWAEERLFITHPNELAVTTFSC